MPVPLHRSIFQGTGPVGLGLGPGVNGTRHYRAWAIPLGLLPYHNRSEKRNVEGGQELRLLPAKRSDRPRPPRQKRLDTRLGSLGGRASEASSFREARAWPETERPDGLRSLGGS